MKIISLLFLLTILGAGCVSRAAQEIKTTTSSTVSVAQPEVVLPLDPNGVAGYNPTYKRFGEYFNDRFRGYHTGEDSEVPPEDLGPGEVQLVPVRAIADGQIVFSSRVSGYGGVVILRHDLDGKIISSLYGHVALSSSKLKVGDQVVRGQFLANLGKGFSKDTDGERQHLHFGLWEGSKIKLAGYVKTSKELNGWINPFDFLTQHDALTLDKNVWLDSTQLIHPPFNNISFSIPPDWDIEYVASDQTLNLYRVSGTGSARERSQISISLKKTDGLSVITTNPKLDPAIYQKVLQSIIVKK